MNSDFNVDLCLSQVGQMIIKMFVSGGSCSKKHHMSKDELLSRLPKLIDRNEAKEEFDELVKMAYIYNHGKHSYALTNLGFMACMELMKRRKTEWKK